MGELRTAGLKPAGAYGVPSGMAPRAFIECFSYTGRSAGRNSVARGVPGRVDALKFRLHLHMLIPCSGDGRTANLSVRWATAFDTASCSRLL